MSRYTTDPCPFCGNTVLNWQIQTYIRKNPKGKIYKVYVYNCPQCRKDFSISVAQWSVKNA